MKVGYLVSEYPSPSHTFIRREIAAVLGAGLAVQPYSVRPGRVAGAPDPADPEVFTILGQGAFAFFAALVWGLARPGRFVGSLALALKHRVPGAKALLWALFHWLEALLLARRLRADGVTRLHNHFANSGANVGLIAAHYLRLPWSLTLHGISEFDYPAGLLLADKLARADFAACVSRFGMAQAMRITDPAIWPKLHLVRCGVDPRDLPPTGDTGERKGLDLICVGRLSPEKGHAGLLQAMAQIVARGLPVRLTLVGDGPSGAMLRAKAAELGLEGHVRFAGAMDERATLAAVAAADALVLASFMEGLPIVLMEAMALGKPVVATRVAGIPELVRDGEAGLLFDPAAWDQLAAHIERLLDPDDRRALGAKGQERVAAAFTYPAAAAPLIQLFGGAADRADLTRARP